MDYNKEALKAHEACKGKVEVVSKMKLENKDDLSIAYTPGVAELLWRARLSCLNPLAMSTHSRSV